MDPLPSTPSTPGAPAPRQQLGNLAGEQHRKLLRDARTAIIAVAILTILAGGFFVYLVEQEIEKSEREIAAARANPQLVIDETQVQQIQASYFEARLLNSITLVLGFVFLGLFFYAKSAPLTATTLALVLYIGAIILGAALDPATIAKGIIIKVIIIYALYRGMKAAKALDELEKSGRNVVTY